MFNCCSRCRPWILTPLNLVIYYLGIRIWEQSESCLAQQNKQTLPTIPPHHHHHHNLMLPFLTRWVTCITIPNNEVLISHSWMHYHNTKYILHNKSKCSLLLLMSNKFKLIFQWAPAATGCCTVQLSVCLSRNLLRALSLLISALIVFESWNKNHITITM